MAHGSARRWSRGMVTAAALAALAAVPATAPAAPAGTLHAPDLFTEVPLNAFSVVSTPTGPEFRYTHWTNNGGPGPLEIQPAYNEAAGTYQGTQRTYTHNAAGTWQLSSSRRVPSSFEFHAAHGHFHFPLAAFGLYQVAPDGGVGAPVAVSPKNGFCIGDSFIYDQSLPHAASYPNPSGNCNDPLSLRAMAVGGTDEYDYRDPGQSIPITGVPDGTYWFRAASDPFNDLAEANEANNATDVRVTIAGSTVTASTVAHPDTTPPTVSVTAPADLARVQGTIALSATTSVSGSGRVQFILDGNPIGTSGDAASPYGLAWDSRTVVDGQHWLAARATDAAGRTNTSEVVRLDVANNAPPPPPPGVLSIDGTATGNGRSSVTTAALNTTTGGDLLLAFVSADGPTSGGQTTTVTGAGLTWTLVRRQNARLGTSEVWRATATAALTGARVTATQARPGYDESIAVIAFSSAAGVGATSGASAANGAPSTSVTTTQGGSWVFGVGNDWDNSIARTLGANQVMRHQWVDTAVGDTFWVQSQASPTGAAGTVVPINDTAPTTDQWNLVAVEVLPGSPLPPPPPDGAPPQVSITDPGDNATVSGIAGIGATASDNVGVTQVQFKIDGQSLGAPDTAPPFMAQWDSRAASNGQHTLTAEARDAAGNVGVSPTVTVTVNNTAPPPAAITVDAAVARQGTGNLTAPALTTPSAGDLIVAFVALDGPDSAGSQTATVSGGGLTWTLVKRSNTQAGDSEIWAAKATGRLSGAVITARPLRAGFDGLLRVVAFKNAAATGAAAAAGARTGAPDVYVPGVDAGSWVWAVGNDWDRAVGRTPIAGQPLNHQWVDTRVGDTFWVQSTAAPNTFLSLVTIHDNAPTNDRWNYAAAAIVPVPGA